VKFFVRCRALALGGVLGAVGLVGVAAGCGGNNNNSVNNNGQTTVMRLTINWPALPSATPTPTPSSSPAATDPPRSRAVNAPVGARSLALTFSNAHPNGGGPYALPIINRTNEAGAYTQTYITPLALRYGVQTLLNVRFYAETDGVKDGQVDEPGDIDIADEPGTIVGDATITLTVPSDGNINDPIIVGPPPTPTPSPSVSVSDFL
jgi:hypothetical protein